MKNHRSKQRPETSHTNAARQRAAVVGHGSDQGAAHGEGIEAPAEKGGWTHGSWVTSMAHGSWKNLIWMNIR